MLFIPWRLVCRLVMRLVLVRLVSSSCGSSSRVSSRLLSSSFVSYGAPFRPAVRSLCVLSVVAVLYCVLMSSRVRLGVSSRHCVLPVISFSLAARFRLIRGIPSRLSVVGSFLFLCLFLCLRRSVLLSARSCLLSVSVPAIAAAVGGAVVRHGAAGLLFVSHPSHHLPSVRSSGGWGYGAPFYVARRSFIALFMPYRPPLSHRLSSALIACPHIINEEGEGIGNKQGGDERKRQGDYGKQMRTRRIQRDAHRDEGTRRGNETPLMKKRKDNGDEDDKTVPFF